MAVVTLPGDELDFEHELKLSADIKKAASLIGRRQARYLVDMYYQMQDARIRADAQVRSGTGEPNLLLDWNAKNFRRMENRYKSALNVFSNEYRVGRWLQSIVGIGPVISAGLIAQLRMEVWNCAEFKNTHKCKPCTAEAPHGPECKPMRVSTAGHFWSFAGLVPNQKWGKGEYRPWNATLKTLVAFKLGECFVKVQKNKNDVYGKLFRMRRDLEDQKNEAGLFKETALALVDTVGKTTEAYKSYSIGKLPKGHMHERARRYAVKIFLSHLHHVMYRDYFEVDPPKPFIFQDPNNGHTHFIPIPNYDPAVGLQGGGKSIKELKEGDIPAKVATDDPEEAPAE